MDIEKNAPITVSPLDSCRGRGKYTSLPRIKSTRTRPVKSCDVENQMIVLVVIPESQYKIGIPNGK